MMPFLLAEFANREHGLPLYVCCVGSHEQNYLSRPSGYSSHQLLLTRSGKGVFHANGDREHILGEGSALILPAGIPHEYKPDPSEDGWDLGFIAFDGDAAGPIVERLGGTKPVIWKPGNFGELWDRLESLWQQISLSGENGYWDASRRLFDILLLALEGQPGKRTKQQVVPAGQPNSALQNAVKLIHDHYNERLLLSNVAKAAGYSVQHFHRLFLSSYGMTPQRYIHQLRMRRSVQLFHDQPGVSVEKVAQQLGMETSYFIRMFKKTYGKTPKQYLKDE